MSTLNDLIAEKNDLTARLAAAKALLQEFVDDINLVGLSEIRVSETDDEPGWPDLQATLEKAEAWLYGQGESDGDDDDI